MRFGIESKTLWNILGVFATQKLFFELIFNRCELHDISIHLLELKTFRLLCKRALSGENSIKIYRSEIGCVTLKFHSILLVLVYWKVIRNSNSSSMTSSSVEDNYRTVSLRTRPQCLIQFSSRITISILVFYSLTMDSHPWQGTCKWLTACFQNQLISSLFIFSFRKLIKTIWYFNKINSLLSFGEWRLSLSLTIAAIR